MRSLSAAASHLPPSGTKVAFPWLSLAGTPPLLDNPLAVAEGQDNE